MPTCEKHGIYYTGFKCPECNQEDIKSWRVSEKEKKQKAKKDGAKYRLTQQRKVSSNTVVRDKLKAKLQAAWRKRIFPVYEKLGLTKSCWICGKGFPPKPNHIMSAPHVSHYFAKGTLWRLWCEPVNSGILCHTCNVSRPETAAQMEPMMVKVWGKEMVEELKAKAEECDLRIKTGQDRRYPPNEWFLSEVEFVKTMVIQ